MEVPRLGVESELQLPAYTTATAMQDLSLVCDLHHSSQQHWILNPWSEARGRTRVLMDTSWICFCCVMIGTPKDPSHMGSRSNLLTSFLPNFLCKFSPHPK